jgi:hypothetical protein
MGTPVPSPFYSFISLSLLQQPINDANPGRSIFTCALETPLVKPELLSLCFFPLTTFFL